MNIVRLLSACRPAWQLGILLLYSFVGHTLWLQTVIGIAGAVFIAANLTLLSQREHAGWTRVQRTVILVEVWVAFAAALVLSHVWPMGPASLLTIPSFVTFAWMFRPQGWTYVMSMMPLAVILLIGRSAMDGIRASALAGTNEAMVGTLLVALYIAMSGLGALLGFLLQRQRQESLALANTVQVVNSQSETLQKLNAQISDYANQVYDLATVQERNRIAGEIHDTVAHRLTALIVQLQASRRFVEAVGSRPPGQVTDLTEDAIGNLDVCEALAREALDEVRKSVRSIRQPAELEGVEVLQRVARNYAALTGMDVVVDLPPDLPPLPARVLPALHRVLEESLTNAQRHGHATRVQVSMGHVQGQLLMQIDDNGRGTSTLHYGFGLSAMRDRLRTFGAEMEIQSAVGAGFTIRLKVPLWEETVP